HKCLEKRPERRYATAAELAADLRRWLAGEPVTARRVNSLDRALKWVRRNPVISGAAAAVFVALSAGAAVATYYAVEAGRQAKQAHENEGTAKRERDEKEAQRAEAVAAKAELVKANAALKDEQD